MMGFSATRAFVLTVLASALTGCWQIEDVGDLPGGAGVSEAWGINELGEVVGYATDADGSRAFRWQRGAGLSPLPSPDGARDCVAVAINDAGVTVGHCLTGAAAQKMAVAWTDAGIQPLKLSGRRILASELFAISRAGDVAGSFREEIGRSFVQDIAFTWRPGEGTAVRVITPMPADQGGSGAARAISSLGWVTGHAYLTPHQPWLWNPGTGRTYPVGELPAAISTGGEARGINDQRQIVGVFDGRGYVWTPAGPSEVQGTAVEIPLDPYDINNHGQVVGVQGGRAVLYELGSAQLTVLEDLPEIRRAGWRRIALARAINDRGQIVGYGINESGEVRGFVMAPD